MDQRLAGCRVLVIEDDFFQAVDLEDALTRAGADVIGPIGHLDNALSHVGAEEFDLAVVDINLGNDTAYSIADALAEKGVPFLFATGHSPRDIPERYRRWRVLEKPYDIRTLIAAFAAMMPPRDGCKNSAGGAG